VGKTGKNRVEERLLESFLKKPFIIQAACFSSVNRRACLRESVCALCVCMRVHVNACDTESDEWDDLHGNVLPRMQTQYAAGAVHCSSVVFVVTGLCPLIKSLIKFM